MGGVRGKGGGLERGGAVGGGFRGPRKGKEVVVGCKIHDLCDTKGVEGCTKFNSVWGIRTQRRRTKMGCHSWDALAVCRGGGRASVGG